MISILYSHRLRALPFVDGDFVPGEANYSYSIVARRLYSALIHSGLPVHTVDFPGIYTTKLAVNRLRQRLAPNHQLFHMAVKPLDHIELMSGVPNVVHYAWEFDRITAQRTNRDPRTNQLSLLRQFDNIFVPCTFQRAVFRAAGLTKTVVVPTPIPVSDANDRQKENGVDGVARALKLAAFDFCARTNVLLDIGDLANSHKGRIFLIVLNPFDRRKNFRNLLCAAASVQTEATFLFKITLNASRDTIGTIISHFNIQSVKAKKARIYFIPSYIADDDMNRLMRVATFALSASSGEGQNLPLLEGMAHGQIPVAPRHTAMLDYVRSDIGCVVASHPVNAPPRSSYLGEAALRAYVSGQEDISLALADALNLSATDIEARSRACRTLVADQYSIEAVSQSLRSAFGSM